MLKYHRIARGILQGNALEAPYRLNLGLTNLCDSKCKTCDIWQIYPRGALDVRQELKLEEWQKIFAKLPSSVMWLSFSGGEPHLRKDFVQIMEAAFQVPNVAMVNVPNNGIKRDLEVRNWKHLLAIKKRPYLYISMSLDGHREVHDEVRGIKGNYDSAVGALEDISALIKEHGNAALGVGLTVSRFNYQDAPAFARHCLDQGWKVKVEAAYSGELYYQGLTGPRPNLQAEGVRDAIRDIYALLRERQWKYTNPSDYLERWHTEGILKFLENPKQLVLPCSAAKSNYAFDCYGNINPCFFYAADFGNIREADYDLMRLLEANRAKVEKARERIAKHDCPKCWLVCNSIDSMIDQKLRHPLKPLM